MKALAPRDTARALVFDPDGRLLLIAYEAARDVDPARPGLRRVWCTPGGGLEPGETHEVALMRELAEEIGVTDAQYGPCVAWRESPLTIWRRPCLARERYFSVRLPSAAFDPATLAATEGDPVLDVRWWRVEDLAASAEIVEPIGILALAQRLLAGETPAAPVNLE
jgi:8-oxo-dGTP pyrophosphatase MutT (NUDIX family)